MRCRTRLLLATAYLCGAIVSGWAAETGAEVVVVYNKRQDGSKKVAEDYASKRGVPERQVLGLSLATTEQITRDEFNKRLRDPIARFLEKQKLWQVDEVALPANEEASTRTEKRVVQSDIRYLVLTYGVPLKIAPDKNLKEADIEKLRTEFRRNEAAVDSELMTLPLVHNDVRITGLQRNPVYATTNAASIHPTNGVLMVTRLDGPTAELAGGLVDKALQAERDGLWGRFYFDTRGVTDPGLKRGDEWIGAAAEMSRMLGFPTTLNTNSWTFPLGFPMSQIGFYAGWYREHVCGPFLDTPVEFMPGAFAYHLHSFSANTLRSDTKHWVGPLIARGATLSMGSVYEPYLIGTPDIAVFTSRFLYQGMSYGEAATAAQLFASWQTTIVGDPLFRPFARSPQKIHDELVKKKSRLAEWSHLRLINLIITRDRPKAQAVAYLEQLPLTAESAVLTEKLAGLYADLGKPASALHTWKAALQLNPSRQQRIRIRLTLGEHLAQAGRDQEAFEDYVALLEENPSYPDAVRIYRKLVPLAKKLKKPDDVKRFEDEIARRTEASTTSNQ